MSDDNEGFTGADEAAREEHYTPDFYDRNPTAKEFRGRLIEMRSQEHLLRSAIHYMKDVRKWRGLHLWVLVGYVTGHGSGYSQQICEELGWPHDLRVSPTMRLPPRVTANHQL